MNKKIEEFRDIYYKEHKIVKDDKKIFRLNYPGYETHPMRIMNFVKKENNINNIDNLFIVKILNTFREFYLYFFVYDELKFKIRFFSKTSYFYEVFDEGKWKSLSIDIINRLKKDRLLLNEIEIIKNLIVNELENNTTERIKFLLNKKG